MAFGRYCFTVVDIQLHKPTIYLLLKYVIYIAIFVIIFSWLSLPGESSCNHWRAPVYFGESINTKVGFYGRKCVSWVLHALGWCDVFPSKQEMIMGEYVPNKWVALKKKKKHFNFKNFSMNSIYFYFNIFLYNIRTLTVLIFFLFLSFRTSMIF